MIRWALIAGGAYLAWRWWADGQPGGSSYDPRTGLRQSWGSHARPRLDEMLSNLTRTDSGATWSDGEEIVKSPEARKGIH